MNDILISLYFIFPFYFLKMAYMHFFAFSKVPWTFGLAMAFCKSSISNIMFEGESRRYRSWENNESERLVSFLLSRFLFYFPVFHFHQFWSLFRYRNCRVGSKNWWGKLSCTPMVKRSILKSIKIEKSVFLYKK